MPGGVFIGRVDIAVPAKNAYFVVPISSRRSGNWSRPVDNGVLRPYGKGEIVLCADTDMGWFVLGRGPVSPRGEKKDGDTQKTPEELQAEQTPELALQEIQGGTIDTAPNYRAKGEEPILPGDMLIQHHTWPPEDVPTAHPSFMGFYRDGSIVLDSGLLSFLLSNAEGAARVRCERLGLEMIPGMSIDVGMTDPSAGKVIEDTSKDVNTFFTSGVSDTTREKEKVRANGYFFSDPDEMAGPPPGVPDLSFEAGRCRETGDWEHGISPRTKGKKLAKGFKFRFCDFLDFEIDIENKELRLTIYDPENPDSFGAPFQFRLNPDEAVLTKGSQFISFQEKGIFLKGQLLGLAGPWTMWSEADRAKFEHDSMPETRVDGEPFLSTVCEWKDDPVLGSGPKFTRSAYFGQNEEPAVLQSFLTGSYSKTLLDLSAHQHTCTAPGSPSSPPLPPPSSDWLEDGTSYADPTGQAYLQDISVIKI